MTEPPPSVRSRVTIGQANDPNAALGAAVAYLMRAQVFARQPFGGWSRVLVGQVNRRHYALARREGRTVGFVGFGRCEHAAIDRFLHHGIAPTSDECQSGPCVLINAWMADERAVSLSLRRWLLNSLDTYDVVVAKRIYDDGTSRPVWMSCRPKTAPYRAE